MPMILVNLSSNCASTLMLTAGPTQYYCLHTLFLRILTAGPSVNTVLFTVYVTLVRICACANSGA